VAKGGLIGHVRPSTHAPANDTFPNGSEVNVDCKVSGTATLKKRVGPTTSEGNTGTYAMGRAFRVQCFTDSGQKWYLTDGSRWVSATYVKTS
jgi:hypothetical protein